MDQQRWEIIKEVFDTALELPSSEREAFILAASEGDAEVYSELKSLIQADEDAGDFLETPILAGSAFEQLAVHEQPLQPGEILCQRFRILRAVGEGGMGYVFEAWDTELRRSVALKAIRPEIASHPESLKRFRQEVSLALSITHPNVCRTFDIERETRVVDATTGRTREVVFLTMEFLQGETLAARLSRTGALPLDEGLRIARQIADALTCAHELGIYHRDIKPANVMLVPAAASQSSASSSSPEFPRAVITDFGLARQEAILRPDGLSGVSSSGIPLGTFAYMAPEQLECAETSAATDIYAFGLVLFEMVTGKRAFSSSNPLSGIKQRLTGPAPSPQSVAPNLPEPWCRAIEGCLRSNPAERLQRAADVVAILDGERVLLPPIRTRKFISHGSTTRRFGRDPWSIRGRISALAAILVFAVSLLIGGLRLYQSKTDSKVTPGALVYLTQVKNQTGEKTFDNLTELIQAGLTQSAQINLLDQGRVGDILQQMTKSPDTVITEPIAREIALRAGAPRVVFATVSGANSSYKLNIDIQQPDASSPNRYRDHWARSFEWQTSGDSNSQKTIPDRLLSTIRSASEWIRLETGESKNDIARLDAPPEDATTGNWEALLDFDKAVNLQRNLKTEEAILYLQRAVEADPNFALAYGRLGDLQVSTGASEDGLRSYARALELTELQRLTPRERDRIRGLAAADSGDFETAENAFRDYAMNYEHDYLGWFYLGYPLMMLGRKDEGLADVKKSYELEPLSVSPAMQLGMFDAATGHFQEAAELAKHLNENGHSSYAHQILGLVSFLEGKYNDAEEHFTALSNEPSPSSRTRGTMMLAHLAAEQGKFTRAVELLSRGMLEDRQEGRLVDEAAKLIDRADLEERLGAYQAMLSDIQAALSQDKSPVRIQSAALILGKSLPRVSPSVSVQVRNHLTQLDRDYSGNELGNYSKLAKFRLHTQVLLANEQWEEALSECRKADALDAPVNDRTYLALTLLTVADHEAQPKRRMILFGEAYTAYRRTVLDPGLSWKDPYRNLPGFLADEMSTFLDLASQLKKEDAFVSKVRNARQLLRPGYATTGK